MRERLALWLHKQAWHLLDVSDRLLEPATPTLHDDGDWPAEMDNADPRNWGESPQ